MNESEKYYQEQATRPIDELIRREREANMKATASHEYANLGKAVPVETYGSQAGCSTSAPLSERLTLQNIDAAMQYQPWDYSQREAGEQVREALTAAAKAILRTCPDSPFRSVALRNIIDARMNANAAISFRGRF